MRNHWKFLKTVVNKLFEFMHETHPGVQDMACETFLKIVSKCKKKFVVQQVGETEPFISELLTGLTGTIQDLETHQIHMFYEAVGAMIAAEPDAARREDYLGRLMAPPNATWAQIIAQARQAPDALKSGEVVRNLQNLLQTNVSVCTSLGPSFASQLNRIYLDVLAVYKMYSELISTAIATGGPYAAKTSGVKLMRSVKKVALRLIENFVERADDVATVAAQHLPALMDPVLGDYARSVPDARDAEVLSLFATLIDKLKEAARPSIPRVFEAVFETTLRMITKNFEDYPEHRLQFFGLLRAITNNCFSTLFTMTPEQLKLVIDSIVWAFRHTERNIADTGIWSEGGEEEGEGGDVCVLGSASSRAAALLHRARWRLTANKSIPVPPPPSPQVSICCTRCSSCLPSQSRRRSFTRPTTSSSCEKSLPS